MRYLISLLTALWVALPLAGQGGGDQIQIDVQCTAQGICDADFQIYIQVTDATGKVCKVMVDVPESSSADDAALAMAETLYVKCGKEPIVRPGPDTTAIVELPAGCKLVTGKGKTWVYKGSWTEDGNEVFHSVNSGQIVLNVSTDGGTSFESVDLTDPDGNPTKTYGENPPGW